MSEMEGEVKIYMNLKGTLRDSSKGEMPTNPIEVCMAQFVTNFEDTLKFAMADKELGLSEINPRILIAMGLTNIIVNMILTFKDVHSIHGSAKETLKMYDDLMKDVRVMAVNSLGLLEAQLADEKQPN